MKCAVRKKKVLFRRLLDTAQKNVSTMLYNEAKLEAKTIMVRKAKNGKWVQFGKELESGAPGNQRRLWIRLNIAEGRRRV